MERGESLILCYIDDESPPPPQKEDKKKEQDKLKRKRQREKGGKNWDQRLRGSKKETLEKGVTGSFVSMNSFVSFRFLFSFLRCFPFYLSVCLSVY